MKHQDVKPILNARKTCLQSPVMHKQSPTHDSAPELSSLTCGAPQASPGVWVDVALHKPMELYQGVLVAHDPNFIFCLVEALPLDKMLPPLAFVLSEIS